MDGTWWVEPIFLVGWVRGAVLARGVAEEAACNGLVDCFAEKGRRALVEIMTVSVFIRPLRRMR